MVFFMSTNNFILFADLNILNESILDILALIL